MMQYLLTAVFVVGMSAAVALFLWQPWIIFIVPIVVFVAVAWQIAGLILNGQ